MENKTDFQDKTDKREILRILFTLPMKENEKFVQ